MSAELSQEEAAAALQMVKDQIPHRPPFLFVDRLESWDGDKVVGYRLFTDKDFFFAGHFPDYPVVPGVILVESMAQCGGAGVLKRGLLPTGAIIFLATINAARFRRQVRPGEEIRMEITDMKVTRKLLRQKGVAFVGDEVAAEAEWVCVAGPGK